MSEKIKIIHLTDSLGVGGLERNLYNTVTRLDNLKYDKEVWCLLSGGKFADDLSKVGVKVKVFDYQPRMNKFSLLLKLILKLRKSNVHLLHTHGYSCNFIGNLAGLLSFVPIRIATVQNLYYNLSKKEKFKQYLLNFLCNKVIACSESVKMCLVKNIRINPDKIVVIYNSIDTTFMINSDLVVQQMGLRTRFNITDTNIVLGTVSRLVPVKGHKFLIKAIKKLIEKGYKQVRLLIIGDGPLKQELVKLVIDFNLERYVVFTGTIDNVYPFFSIIDIFVQPSIIQEGLPLSIIEAAYFGLPIIASDIGGIREIIIHEKTGLLTVPGDIDMLTKSIEWILNNIEKAKLMGIAAKELCLNKFTSDVTMTQIENLYNFYIKGKLK